MTKIFTICGQTDEIFDEEQISHFTAMTGPVPGFVAYFAQCMVEHAISQGISPDVADRAVRSLFHASAKVMVDTLASPADHVQEMINYDGTTAAGLNAMIESSLSQSISNGLLAAASREQSY